mgnify:CR=1 FL=1
MPTPVKTSRNYFTALAEIQRTLGASREQAREIWLSLKQRSGVAPSVGAIRQIPRRSRPALKGIATRRLKAKTQAKPAIPIKPKQPAKIIQIGPDGVRYVVGVIPPAEPERPSAVKRTEPIKLRKPPAPPAMPLADAAPIQERKPRNKFEQLLQERDVPYLSGEAAKLAAQLWRSPQKQKKLANILRQAHRSIASSGRVADSVRDALSKFIRSVNWPDSNWFSFLRTLYA